MRLYGDLQPCFSFKVELHLRRFYEFFIFGCLDLLLDRRESL